jgi:hypothetical protein
MKALKYVLVALIAATSFSSFSASALMADGDVYSCVEVDNKLICVKR